MKTSSGIKSSSISLRVKSKSSWLADGKATSMVLEAEPTQQLEIFKLLSGIKWIWQGLVSIAKID